MVRFENVSKVYSPTSTALDDVSFSIEPKEFLSIVGKSGAGKTTLLKLLIAEEKPSSGKIFFESINVHDLAKKDLHKIRRRIGIVFQDFRLLPKPDG